MSIWQKIKGWFRKSATKNESKIVVPHKTAGEIAKAPAGLSGDHPPFAKVLNVQMSTKGPYQTKSGGPRGAIVHFTAGRDGAEKTIMDGVKNGYAYWCIQRDGLLCCAHPRNRWGYHAGESAWKGLFGKVSDDLIGIEINAAGKVDLLASGKFKTWFGTTLDQSEVRYTPGKDNQEKGYYQVYTPMQEATLIETLLWLKARDPEIFDFDFVLGHDEVAGPMGIGYWRKNDPGAALSMTMPEFRALLKKKWVERA